MLGSERMANVGNIKDQRLPLRVLRGHLAKRRLEGILLDHIRSGRTRSALDTHSHEWVPEQLCSGERRRAEGIRREGREGVLFASS